MEFCAFEYRLSAMAEVYLSVIESRDNKTSRPGANELQTEIRVSDVFSHGRFINDVAPTSAAYYCIEVPST
jgi:hypothetical protein